MKKTLHHHVESIAALQARLAADSFAAPHAKRLHDAAKALVELAHAATTDHPARHAERVSKAAQRYAEAVQSAKADLTTREMAGRVSLHEQFAVAVGLTPDRYANNIVSAFAGMNQQQKTAALAQMVAQGDGRSLAALSESPSFVHGVDAEMLGQYTKSMEAQHAPEVAERRARFESDLQTARVAFKSAEALAADALQLHDLDAALEGSRQADDAEQRLADATA